MSRSSFFEQQQRPFGRGSPNRRLTQPRRKRNPPRNTFSSQPSFSETPEPFLNIDFHEDFPPLPKSVKPVPSTTLQKITPLSMMSKDTSLSAKVKEAVGQDLTHVADDEAATPILAPQRVGTDIDVEIPSYRSSVHGTPAIPGAPPPSSAELSTAGNTAASTPTAAYIRPRIALQTLHDRLLHANASLATLQQGRPLSMARSTPVSPLLGPSIGFAPMDLEGKILEEETENIPTLDVPVGLSTSRSVSVIS